MLFLVGLSIISGDGSKIEVDESIIKCSRYLLRENDKSLISKNNEPIYLEYKSSVLKNLFYLLKSKINNTYIDISDFDFIEIFDLYKKLDFKVETSRITLLNFSYLLYRTYCDNESMNDLLENDIFKQTLQKIFIEIFEDFLRYVFLPADYKSREFIEKLTRKFNFKFNVSLYSKRSYESFVTEQILINSNLNCLMICILNSDSDILESITSNEFISKGIENLRLDFDNSINIDSIKKFNNLKKLHICKKNSSKLRIHIPELKNLELLRIFSKSIKVFKFSKIERLKILKWIYFDEIKLDEFELDKYFPNLEVLILRYVNLNSETNFDKLIYICQRLKNLKMVYVSAFKKIRSLKIINKLKERIPQIVIHYEFFNNEQSDIYPNNDIDPMIFYGKFVNISEIYSLDLFFKSLYFENTISNYDFLKKYYHNNSIKNLYLSKIYFNNVVFEIFKRLKNIKSIIIKNVEFESNSFYNFIDNLLYDVENLKIYNCFIPKNELKIIRKIKYLKILNIFFPKELEDENFETLFGEINEFEFLELKILNYISYNKKFKDKFKLEKGGTKVEFYILENDIYNLI